MSVGGVEVDFQDINVRVKEKVILKDVSGHAWPGQLLAIMGASGSGKTTLLNVLAGRGVGTMMGSVLMNKKPLNKKQKRQIAYVLQEDIFFENLTLRETLVFSARLRLPTKMLYADKLKKVDDIVEALDLKKCLDTKIGSSMDRGLSGGEKKRTNIGSELLNDPTVLVLDEPTTGLDSTTACSLIDMLKRYAISHRKTVITSIHQPSSQIFYKFDKLMLLSEGEVIYFGSPHDVMEYLASINLPCYIPHYNAADFILDKVKGTKEELDILHKAAKTQQWINYTRSQQPISISGTVQMKEGAASVVEHSEGDRSEVFGSDDDIKKGNTEESTTETPALSADYEPTKTKEVNEIEDGISQTFQNVPMQDMNHQEPLATTKLHGQKEFAANPKLEPNGPSIQQQVDELSIKGKSTDKCVDSDMNLDERWPSSWWEQFSTLTVRAFKHQFSAILTKIDLLRHILLGIIFGIVYWQLDHREERLHDIRGVIFFGTVYWGFDSVFTVISTFPTERTIINKERASGMYRLSAYYLAKITSELPLMIVFPTIQFNIYYWLAGLNNFIGAYLASWSILIFNTLVGQSFGLVISAYSEDMTMAITFLAIFMMSSMLLGGFYVELLPFWLEWTQYLSFLFYTFNLSLRVEFNIRGDPVKCAEESIFIDCITGNATEVDGNTVLDSMDILSVPVWANLVALFAFLFLFRILAYYILKIKYKPK